jgi:hypothetical protein
LPKGKYAELRNLTVTRRQQRRKLNSAFKQTLGHPERILPRARASIQKPVRQSRPMGLKELSLPQVNFSL